jgi:hypothetical protein
MSEQVKFSAVDEERFKALCEPCANQMPVAKNAIGIWMHGSMVCNATRLRTLLAPAEKTIEEQAWTTWNGNACACCRTHKKTRQWFCWNCWKQLPSELQNKLQNGRFYQQYPYLPEALSLLGEKGLREKAVG